MSYPTYNYNPLYPNQYAQPNSYMQIQQPTNTIEVRYVKENEATDFIPEINKKIFFFITDKKMAIFKATDMMGFTTTKKYKMEEMEDLSSEAKTVEFDPKEFVKTSDLQGFVKEDVLNSKIDALTRQITDLSNQIKGGVKDEQPN